MPKSMSLMLSSRVDHDVFRLQVAVDNAVGVKVVERFQNAQRMRMARSRRQLALLVEDLAQQAAFDPLHDHVDLAAVVVGEDLHHAGMVHHLADFFFAAKAVEESGIAFNFGMRNLDGDGAAGIEIGGAEDRRHAAAGSQSFDAVVIELIAGVERSSCTDPVKGTLHAATHSQA